LWPVNTGRKEPNACCPVGPFARVPYLQLPFQANLQAEISNSATRLPSAWYKLREAVPFRAADFQCRRPWLPSSRKSRRKSHPRWLHRTPYRKRVSLLALSEDNSPGSRPGSERGLRRRLPKRRMLDKAMPDGSSGLAPKKARSLLRRRADCPPAGCEER